MKQLFTILFLITSTSLLLAQNVDYESRITQFYGSNCGSEVGNEEHTWKGYLSDNVNTAETYSGCIECTTNGSCTRTGSYAIRNRYNVTSTQIRTRIDAWEDDNGARCSYATGFWINDDECRANQTCTYNFTTPLEYQWTSANQTCGSGDYNMNTFYQYRYATTTIPTAVDNSTFGFTTGGNRGFWGSRGAWATSGSDCATSGTITNNQTSSFSTTVNCIDQITFRWNVSSEANFDFLRFYINGVEQASISGTPGWATVTFNLDPNIDNILEWRYTKDGSVSSNLDRGFVDQITYRNYTIPVVGTSFGSNQWNVSCYNGRNLTLSGVTYRGYYVENNLNINTTNHWASGSTPSNAASYDGCSVGVDNHTFVHKRQGFPCGVYNLNITGHDDEIIIYVNGAQVWNFNGCCTNHGTVWTGYLTASSTVEIRVAEGGGGSNLTMNLLDVTPSINGGAVVGTQSICPGGNPTNLSSTAAATGGTLVYTGTNYQWQQSTVNCSSGFANIGGAVGLSYDPPTDPGQTTYYRRRITDACGTVSYSNCITVTRNPLPNGNLVGTTTICDGNSTNLTFNGTAGASPWDITYNGTTLNNINTGTNISVSPTANTTYTISSITDNNGCTRTTGIGSSATVTVNTNSTPLTIATVGAKQCPNSNITLSASGGVAGTGSDIVWYSSANGGGTNLGTGSTIIVSPTENTTYYARREGTCNTTADAIRTVDVKNFVYTGLGVAASVGYCTDKDNWHHFYDINDDIIFSIEGDLSGATGTPIASIQNNGSFFQATKGAVGSCVNGWSPGEEQFEMQRSWNVTFVGTLNPPYNVRYYFPNTEKTAIETAANDFIANNVACGYTYKYANPNGFFWFKNTATTYVAPLFDQPTKLTGSNGSINGVNYAEIIGISSFSGGSGSVVLSPNVDLPVELTAFSGKYINQKNSLKWTTETEINNSHFVVQHSADPTEGFADIGTVAGNGNTNSPIMYGFEHQTPVVGINYYRLKQVDYDGTVTYSKTIAIDVISTLSNYIFYPNPTTTKITYQFVREEEEQLDIKILNTLGQKVASYSYNAQEGINTYTIDMRDYPAGVYHITVIDSNGITIANEKITKVKQ